MNEKERLIKWLGYKYNCVDRNKCLEEQADYLLDNDVNVPPVKIGTRVYTIICGQIYEYEVASYTLDGDGFSFIHLAYMMGNTMHGKTHTIEEFKRQYYLTKKQAEKSIERRCDK